MGLILIIATLGVTLLVRQWLMRTYKKYAQQGNTSGLTGAETARAILDANNLKDVVVERVEGTLSDHYDPRSRTVRLSAMNYDQSSVAGMAVAAHEVGHAIQHANAYAPLQWRATLVPVASIGANFGPILIFVGAIFSVGGLFQIGFLLFGAAALFQLVTLPVEFDASNRAMNQLEQMGLATSGDAGGARKVLNAAALTYVAALATTVAWLLYYAMIFTGQD